MKLKIYITSMIAVALLLSASAANALDLDVGVNANLGVSANQNARGQGSATTGVNVSASSSNNTGVRGNATSSLRTEVRGNATSSAARDRQATTTRGQGEVHRSEVATFVRTLLDASNRMGGIGAQVRVVAQEQASSSEKVRDAMTAIENRGSVRTFLFGSDYKNLGTLRSEIVSTRNRLTQLSRELDRLPPTSERFTIQNEIDALEQTEVKLEAFIKANESKFGLFGWLNKLINR